MKKTLKGLIVLPVVIIGLMVVGLAANKIKSNNFNKLSTLDQGMLLDLSETHQMYRENKEDIWGSSYDFSKVPLILTPVSRDKGIWHTHSYAVGIPEMGGSIFAEKVIFPDTLRLDTVYRVSGFHPRLWPTWLPFNFTFASVGNTHSLFMKYSEQNFEENSGLHEFKYFLMHEAFHEFHQVRLWENVNNMNSSIWGVERSAEMYQYFMTELSILDAINQEKNPEILQIILLDFITLRNHRYEHWPFMKQEMTPETLEGTATYIEEKYKRLLWGDDFELSMTFTDFFLGSAFKNAIENGVISGFIDKDIYYSIGANLGLAMDLIGLDWKASADHEELMYNILEEHFQDKESRSINDIKTAYGFDNFEAPAGILVAYFLDKSN